MGQRTKGKCKYCGKEYTLSGINRHLSACKARKEHLLNGVNKKRYGYYQLTITGKYNRDYWMVIEMPETARLWKLDDFLRDIWVECCGHLSAFFINGVMYEAEPELDECSSMELESLSCCLKEILQPGMTFTYEYDFGSTTTLSLTVTSYRTGGKEKDEVTILSRNNPIVHLCDRCGKPATVIELYEREFLCDECLAKREEDDEDLYYLSVCNSPRMGVCGYDGSEIYPDQFEPDSEQEKENEPV